MYIGILFHWINYLLMKTIIRLCSLFGITDLDKTNLRKLYPFVEKEMDTMIDKWYSWLSVQPEFEEFFGDDESLNRVKDLQKKFWIRFFQDDIDDQYFEIRSNVGKVHARIGLSKELYLGGLDHMLEHFVDLLEKVDLSIDEKKGIRRAINKLAHLDVAIILQSYETLVMEKISAQSKSLLEMSTPVTQLWSGLLLLPVVGLIDSKRAQDIMDNSLMKIAETHAQSFILDISGVGFVDTAVANHLIKITRATKLMGCECIISGLSPAVAETIVELGIDVGTIKTTANMKSALDIAFERLGMEIIKK
jgi:rsbT co-antagonist protein RsbR